MDSRRRKILYLTNRVPYPPDKGDRIRTFHQIDRLSLRHDVYCATFVEQPGDATRAARLRRWCRDVLAIPWRKGPALTRAARSFLAGGTLTHGAYEHPVMVRQIRRWAERQSFDTVICFSSIMAPYARLVPAQRRILDLCDVDSEKWSDYSRNARMPLSRVFATEARRLAAFEHAAMNAFDDTIVITKRERRMLDAFETNPRLHVVGNGVSGVERFSDPTTRGPVVGFLGQMDYRPNVQGICWFAQHVWPQIRNQFAEAQLNIIGRSPARAVRRLGRLPGINVTGAVRETRSHLDRCRAVIAPLQIARGLPNKILEAMAAGRPVVATPAAADCLCAEPSRDLLVADEADAFADALTSLLRDDKLCASIAHSGHAWVTRHHSWEPTLDAFERVVLGIPSDAALPISRKAPAKSLTPAVPTDASVNEVATVS